MSNPLAIAAVTATLQRLLSAVSDAPELADATVTTRPLDQARTPGNNASQLNLFLYLMAPNAAWRNADMPAQTRPGETAFSPLALNLYYLMTAYGRDNEDAFAHRLLGEAMRILHDHPLLGADEIASALPGNDLSRQIERVRFTMHALSPDEMSKLWSAFQTEYRLSVAYEAAAVLIESERAARTPLPVLRRGEQDRGTAVYADARPPFPGITTVQPLGGEPAAQAGDLLTITGDHLDGDAVRVRFSTLRVRSPFMIDAEPAGGADRLTVRLPDLPDEWPAGLYSTAVVVTAAGATRTTNELPLQLAPEITDLQPQSASAASGVADLVDVTVKVTCAPKILPEQRVALLLGSKEVSAPDHPAKTDRLEFRVADVSKGSHYVRLRVDGVDSRFIDRSQTPPVFIARYQVTFP